MNQTQYHVVGPFQNNSVMGCSTLESNFNGLNPGLQPSKPTIFLNTSLSVLPVRHNPPPLFLKSKTKTKLHF